MPAASSQTALESVDSVWHHAQSKQQPAGRVVCWPAHHPSATRLLRRALIPPFAFWQSSAPAALDLGVAGIYIHHPSGPHVATSPGLFDDDDDDNNGDDNNNNNDDNIANLPPPPLIDQTPPILRPSPKFAHRQTTAPSRILP